MILQQQNLKKYKNQTSQPHLHIIQEQEQVMDQRLHLQLRQVPQLMMLLLQKMV